MKHQITERIPQRIDPPIYLDLSANLTKKLPHPDDLRTIRNIRNLVAPLDTFDDNLNSDAHRRYGFTKFYLKRP